MSIVINDIKRDAVFKDEQGNLIHILESNVEKTWQSAKGKLKYNTIVDGQIKASISSIQTFQDKMPSLEKATLDELNKVYLQLSGSAE